MERQNYRVSVRQHNAQEPVDVIIEAPGAYQALQIARIEYGERAVVSQVATPVLGAGVRPTPPPRPPTPQWMTRPGGPLAYPFYALSDFIVARAFANVDPKSPRGRRISKLVTVAVCVGVVVGILTVLGVLQSLGVTGGGG